MSAKILFSVLSISILLAACSPAGLPAPVDTMTLPETADSTNTATDAPSETPLPTLTATLPPTETATPLPTETATPTPVPTVESLEATVTVNLLTCRYGPGPEYLYLYALREGARIKLIGQTGGNNWVWVEGKNKCWVNIKYLGIKGDFKTLPIVYPEPAKLPRVGYYNPTTVLSATRDGNQVTVVWLGIPVSPGDYETPDMFIYIIEVWRCEGGQIIFDPLASNRETISFMDEPGCTQPSHGRVIVQDKHGYTAPAEIPWPLAIP
jgi:hypothetical protein